jgi:hypothetical protein
MEALHFKYALNPFLVGWPPLTTPAACDTSFDSKKLYDR